MKFNLKSIIVIASLSFSAINSTVITQKTEITNKAVPVNELAPGLNENISLERRSKLKKLMKKHKNKHKYSKKGKDGYNSANDDKYDNNNYDDAY